jgi:hypothetical protein
MGEKKILRNQAIKEILACASDPIYFIENYCKVQHEKRGLVYFKLYPYQKQALKEMLNNEKLIVNKARQLGFSTLTAAFILWLILFHYDKKVLVIATKAEVAKNMITKVKIMLSKIPRWMFLSDIEINRAHMVGLKNRSWVKAIATSEDAGRSEALSLLVLDEAAHIANMDDVWGAAAATLSTGGKVIALSTPKGVQNWFHKYFTEAENGQNDWKSFTAHWWEHPEYAEGLKEDLNVPGGKTSPWFAKITSGWTKQKIAQELLTSFIDTASTYFDLETIQEIEKTAQDPLEKTWNDKNLWIWKYPILGKKYLITADSASGVSEDYSACAVIDLWNMEVVAEYLGKLQPDLFGDFLCELGNMYNQAYICPENESYGYAVCQQILKNSYKNICFFDGNGKLVDKWYGQWNGIIPGFRTDPKSRPMILAKLEEYFRKKYFITNSKRFIGELYTFSVINGKPQAQKNQHDDLIIAYAIGIWVRDTVPDFGIANGESTKQQYSLPFHIERHTLSQRPIDAKIIQTEIAKSQEKIRIKEKLDKQRMIINHPANYWLGRR